MIIMDKTNEALKKILELSQCRRDDKFLEGLARDTGGQLEQIKYVLKRLFSKEYDASLDAYITDIKAKLKTENGSVDVALSLSEDLRLLHEFQKHGERWYERLEQNNYFL